MKTAVRFLLICLMICPFFVKAQSELRYGLGAALHVEAIDELSIYNGIIINPKIVFPFKAEHAISLGGAYTLCLNRNENYSNFITINFPILVDYNYGLGSSMHSQKQTGFFAGMGYQSVIYGFNDITSGYVFNAGFRLLDLTPNRPETANSFRIEKEGFMRVYFPDDDAYNQIVAIGLQFNFPTYPSTTQ